MTRTAPLDSSLRDRVARALHCSRRGQRSATISRDILPMLRELADAFIEAAREDGIVVVLGAEGAA